MDSNPSVERNVPTLFTEHNTGRTALIGGSNLGRIAKATADNRHMVVDLNASGWIPKSGKIEKLCETLKKLNLTKLDTVIINPMSNFTYLGTDEDGLPIPAAKSAEDGRYHLQGNILHTPRSPFRLSIKLMNKVIAQAGGGGGGKVVLILPLKRYALAAWWDDTSSVC